MPERLLVFFALSLVTLLVVAGIFGMKYFTAARTSVAALRAEFAEAKLRLAAVEKLLCDVG